MTRMPENCFHCGEPVPDELDLLVEIDNQAQAMCCFGCEAVARQLIEFGLTNYYRHRTTLPKKPESLVPETLKKLTTFNDPQIQSEFVSHNDDSSKEARLIIEGISCPACVWLIESRLTKLKGIKQVGVNYSTQRCRIVWQEDEIHLSDILTAITQLGYNAFPYNHKQRELIYENERKTQLLRLGIASLFGMQVMMIAIALYFGDVSGIEKQYRVFFHWISLLLTLPVLLFSGKPLFAGAFRDIKNKRPGMDVPIALGLSIAFCGSLWSTLQQSGHVYYDSIVMFIFFILGGRYFEFMSRKKSTAYLDKTSSILPLYATRINANGEKENIELNKLSVSDKILVKPGEVIPVDGMIYEGHSSVNESIITGESLPVTKYAGMNVIGGSTNNESPLYMTVKSIGEYTVLSHISRIIDKASSNKPATVQLANRIVSIFISALLVITCLVAFYWYHVDQTQWLAITIAVLVVSCPCALSLATPTAMSSAASTFMQNGIALINNDSIEKIAKANCFVFDKTGTLTKGELELEYIDIFNTNFNKASVLNIASALESASEHPLAKAIGKAARNTKTTGADNIKNYPGQGVSGSINEQWFIGTHQFIEENCSGNIFDQQTSTHSLRKIFLANSKSVIAALYFNDELRDSSPNLIYYLKKQGKKIILMSGDHDSIVKQVANKLDIDEYQAELKPEDKLNNIIKLQQQGYQVCMIGDGINDAPAFAQADVAIAMAEASDITKLNADMLLLNNKIDTLKTMLKIASKTNRTIHINFIWALAYNLTALPFAMMGYVAPWMAALGMSLSSLIVVINASRITTTDYS
jgi:P-type Cu2+ transporter